MAINNPEPRYIFQDGRVCSRGLGTKLPSLSRTPGRTSTDRLPPPWLLLKKEACVEMMKHIRIVVGAGKKNCDKYPYSYINPRYGIALSHFGTDIPRPDQVPGIQTLIIPLRSRNLISDPQDHSFPSTVDNAVSTVEAICRRPDLKELILLRRLTCFRDGRFIPAEHHCKSSPLSEIYTGCPIERRALGSLVLSMKMWRKYSHQNLLHT